MGGTAPAVDPEGVVVAVVVVLEVARATTVVSQAICRVTVRRSARLLARSVHQAAVAVARATTVERRVTCPATALSVVEETVVVRMTASATTAERAVTCPETVPMVDAQEESATSAVEPITCSVTVQRAVDSTIVRPAATTATSSVIFRETVQSLLRSSRQHQTHVHFVHPVVK